MQQNSEEGAMVKEVKKAKPRRRYVDYDSVTGREQREMLKELIPEYRHDLASLPRL